MHDLILGHIRLLDLCSYKLGVTRKEVGTTFAGDDVPAGGSAKATGTNPSTTYARVMTIAVAGTSPGHLAPSAGVTLPPVMSTVVVKTEVLRLKKPAMKKSSL
jgi:hypothetical protein